jgi:hypothetical protein
MEVEKDLKPFPNIFKKLKPQFESCVICVMSPNPLLCIDKSGCKFFAFSPTLGKKDKDQERKSKNACQIIMLNELVAM